MNVLLFSSDIKGFTYLKSTFKELKDKKHNTVFLYGNSNHVIPHPPSNLDKFNYDSTLPIDFSEGFFIESIGLNIPFIPDYLLLTRDRWAPEQNIIHEFKQKYPQTKIAYIELNTNLIQAIEIKMEMISRTKFPQNQIDIFFDHSKSCLQNKKTSLGWKGWDRGVVVGNPSWDGLDLKEVKNCYKKYKIDKNKTQLLFFIGGGVTRKKSLNCLQIISNKIDRSKYQIYLKPLPGEKTHPLLKKDYEPKFIIEGLDGIIFDQEDLNSMSYICEYNIGHIGSVNYGGVLFNKQIVNLDLYTNGLKDYNNLDLFLENKDNVRENWRADFWMRIHNLQTQQDFIDLVEVKNLETFEKINNSWGDILKLYTHTFDESLNFLSNYKKDTQKLLKYFDDFGDGKSNERIINYLEKNLVA